MKLARGLIIKLLLILSTATASEAAPVKARIQSGTGVLLISTSGALAPSALVIYKEPFLERVAEIAPQKLPVLTQSIVTTEETVPIIASSKKKGWFRIFYDDGEREGWIEERSSYRFYRWEELLKDRQVILLGGLKKEYYQLRKSPEFSATADEPVGKGEKVTALRVEGEWIKVRTDSRTEGWLRWRDDNARLVISLKL